ncbi:MAG: FAD-dependent oxidoreductase [Anaerolineales bacterium]|nr:FAD-dependent oxidoreductase [Anaerolineales bacterium]
MTSKHIIVIGAGISGLTAAFRLQQAGHEVSVVEARQRVGGRMITIDWKGFSIDPGAEFVTSADKFLLEMVRDLGIEDKLIDYSEANTGFDVSVMRDGEVHSFNFMSIASYFGWTGVSLKARLSMLKLLPYMMRAGRADVYYPENAPGTDDVPMEQFFYEKINAEMFEYWVELTMDVFCGYVPEDLSAKMLLLLFGSYLSQKLYTFEGGIGFLPEQLARQVGVTLGAVVSNVEMKADGSGVKVETQVDGQAKTIDADQVVVAVPGDKVLELFDEPLPAWKQFFEKVGYTRVGIVYHHVEGDDPSFEEGGIMFPRKEPWNLSAVGWKRRGDGRVLVMSDLKSHLYDPAISDDELRAKVTDEMIRAVPAFESAIQDQMVFRWPRKVPKYPVGYLTALKAFKHEPQEGPVYFCGDYLIGPNAGAALASGWLCAQRVENCSPPGL